ncbi:hypothetical protein WJX82_007221 [Trebouxia sp. C0006]
MATLNCKVDFACLCRDVSQAVSEVMGDPPSPFGGPGFIGAWSPETMCIVRHVVEYVKTKPIVLPKMHGDKQVAQQRADLVQKLANLDAAASRIKNIKQEFVNDSYEDELLQSLLNAVNALEPEKMPAASQQDAMSGPVSYPWSVCSGLQEC